MSILDEDQPGTDNDKDYYQHKSKSNEEALPPLSGWVTCCLGDDPPPTLKKIGMWTPEGEAYNTPEHQLAKWAVDNRLVELALGDSSHHVVVKKSTKLVMFLSRFCDRFDWLSEDDSHMNVEVAPKQFCLKASHLLFAWKSITKTDDALVLALGTNISATTIYSVVGAAVLTNDFFEGLKRNSSIKKLKLEHCDIYEWTGTKILNTVKERKSNLAEIFSVEL